VQIQVPVSMKFLQDGEGWDNAVPGPVVGGEDLRPRSSLVAPDPAVALLALELSEIGPLHEAGGGLVEPFGLIPRGRGDGHPGELFELQVVEQQPADERGLGVALLGDHEAVRVASENILQEPRLKWLDLPRLAVIQDEMACPSPEVRDRGGFSRGPG